MNLNLDTLLVGIEGRVEVMTLFLEMEEGFLEKVMETLSLNGYL